MHIYIEPSGHRHVNMGDLAMLQAAAARLRVLWPDATLYAHSNDPARLAVYCPGIRPVQKRALDVWMDDWYLYSRRVHDLLPGRISARLLAWERKTRRRWPHSALAVYRQWRRLTGRDTAYLDEFVNHVLGADAIIITGQGGMTDAFVWSDLRILDLLALARQVGIPAVMVGQGMGPATDPRLLVRAQEVLPDVDFISLREQRASLPFLESLGTNPNRIMTTGDDAVELAYRERPDQIGQAVGVNLRVAPYAGVNESIAQTVGAAIRAVGERVGAPLLPVPISFSKGYPDTRAIQQILDNETDGGQDLDTPLKVIRQIGRCRMVVAGSYHAGVFALSQGVPVVALAKSPYYVDKFQGLADQFGAGCEVVLLDGPDLADRLARALDTVWHPADQVREPLLAAAQRQIEQGWAAYRRVYELIEAARG
ncbi:MAG: polysaccharide pyruvyl transferase family protein [Anaerolineae bacterium]|nr:polysaccharide pyruvyl transferase family protein [Anaerolineae bacterium]